MEIRTLKTTPTEFNDNDVVFLLTGNDIDTILNPLFDISEQNSDCEFGWHLAEFASDLQDMRLGRQTERWATV